jgi:hypothetical protein
MRGEVLSATRRQSRLGLPTHTLTLWDPETQKAKLIARRSTDKVRYIRQVKHALGYRIPPDDDEVDELAREGLDRLAEEIRRVNQSLRCEEALTERTAEGCAVFDRGMMWQACRAGGSARRDMG